MVLSSRDFVGKNNNKENGQSNRVRWFLPVVSELFFSDTNTLIYKAFPSSFVSLRRVFDKPLQIPIGRAGGQFSVHSCLQSKHELFHDGPRREGIEAPNYLGISSVLNKGGERIFTSSLSSDPRAHFKARPILQQGNGCLDGSLVFCRRPGESCGRRLCLVQTATNAARRATLGDRSHSTRATVVCRFCRRLW